MKQQLLQSFRLKSFKAIQDSGTVKLTPLTALIGDNGSGKSSLVEGMETLQAIVDQGLDRAMQTWRGFEHIWNQGMAHTLKQPQVGEHGGKKRYEPRAYHTNPMVFDLRGEIDTPTAWNLDSGSRLDTGFRLDSVPVSGKYQVAMEINASPALNEIFIQHERLILNGNIWYERDAEGSVIDQSQPDQPSTQFVLPAGESILSKRFGGFISNWQFLSLVPQNMGSPLPQKRTGGTVRLARDGSNIAEYLLDIRRLDPGAFEGILETLHYVLPYARDLQPALTSELQRAVYLQLTEKNFKVPGWLLSTGTLRIVALLALLRHPTPPPLIVIDEIENGLDPRTVHLIVDEMRAALEEEKTQVILTTHSPYLLDLLDISQIVLVERKEGQPVFSRPDDNAALQDWARRFSPGKLYTTGRLNTVGD